MLHYVDGLATGGPKGKTKFSLSTVYSAILAEPKKKDSSYTVKLMLVLMQAEPVSQKHLLHNQALQTCAKHVSQL